jgi:hypothetical protein
MANIKELIQSIESLDSSFDEKLEALNKMEETLVAMRQQEETAVQDNVDLIVEAIKVMENKVTAQLEVAKSIVPEKGDKGDKGKDGKDGKSGLDGKNGKDGLNGKDGQDGKDGVSVTDAHIDFDGSLVITLSTGQEINVGEVVAPELQEKIKLVTSGGAGTVLPDQSGNANKYLKTSGTTLSWDTLNGSDIDLSSPPTIGNTAPNTGSFTTLIGGGSSANYGQLTGGATTKAVEFQTLGSDSNIALVLDSKGTGAIDLASGSSGVNISNGGTVTAITRTAAGSAYTSQPTVAITAPTTAGGVQATATVTIVLAAVSSIAGGGTGYTAGDVLTISGGTSAQTAQLTVSTVSAGVITAVTVSRGGDYTVAPSNPASVTGGIGTGATFNLTFGILAFTITNAGSGYVEQPTVSFSGGGGSGATAYATVGATTTFRTIGHTGTVAMRFDVPSSLTNNIPTLRLIDSGNAQDSGVQVSGGVGGSFMNAFGAANATVGLFSAGTGLVSFGSGGTSQTKQLAVSHTASAVNYVQATGSATGGVPIISAQGSDGTVALGLASKGAKEVVFYTSGTTRQVAVTHTASTANYLTLTGSAASASPIISVAGSDADIDLTLTPKGTGAVRFGTYTGTILTPTGYITIKDSGGTSRRLLVG